MQMRTGVISAGSEAGYGTNQVLCAEKTAVVGEVNAELDSSTVLHPL